MPYGLPDYDSPVNISGQTVPEVIIREKYGVIESVNDYDLLDLNSTLFLTIASARGKIFDARIYMESKTGVHDPATIIGVNIDGAGVIGMTIDDIYWHKMFQALPLNLYAAHYDDTNGFYALNVHPGVTFETSLQISVENGALTQYDVWWIITYGII